MAIVYCHLCERKVDAKRNFGIGTIILLVCTAGAWIFALPFYKQRCPICRTDLIGKDKDVTSVSKSPLAQLGKFIFLIIAIGLISNLLFGKKQKHSEQEVSQQIQPVAAKAQPATPVISGCSKSPFEILPVGQTFYAVDLTRLIDTYCPNADYTDYHWSKQKQVNVAVTHENQTYLIWMELFVHNQQNAYQITSIKRKDAM